MRLYLITGFELDLFSKFEYYYVYWYLCEVILKWQANTLNRAENFLTSLDQYLTSNMSLTPILSNLCWVNSLVYS